MHLPLLAAALLLHALPADTLPQALPEEMATAYLDADAREMVRRVRDRRAVVDQSIVAYQALARQRISVGLRALRRDRILFRDEVAANVYWRREGEGKIEVLGARQVVPMVQSRASVPDDIRTDAPDLAFDPSRDQILQGFGDDESFRHPLASGSEADYRFQSGDTMRIRLEEGRTLRLVELRVIPRRPADVLLRGSFWLDAETHAPVRATFRLTRTVDLHRDLDDDGDIPAALKPIRARLRYFTIDYGLWDGRWWLPRLVSLELLAQVGGLVEVPVSFERSYTDYRVAGAGDERAMAAILAHDAGRAGEEVADSVRSCDRGSCSRYTIELPADTLSLLNGEFLPPSIYGEGESLITESELREIAGVLGMSPPGAAAWQRPEIRLSYLQADLVRFNRVEGLALGARADAELGPVAADAVLWLGTASADLSGELGVTRSGFRASNRLAAYRRLAAVDPDPRALGLGSSLSALLLGRDDSDYFRALGAELVGETLPGDGLQYRWRLFAERQGTAERSTDFSLPHLLDRERGFAPNIVADAADQAGVGAAVRLARGQDPQGLQWGGEAALGAEAGTYRLVRPSLSVHAAFPLPIGLAGALEVAGGGAWGDVPLQRHWFLGGPATVRGFGGGSRVHGEAFWRARAEVGRGPPGARLVLFSDAGWAGERAAFAIDPALASVGAGVSVLDGLLRLDLARAVRGGRGWRLDLQLNAGF